MNWRIFSCSLALLLSSWGLSAEEVYLGSFSPLSPRLMASGMAGTATARGIDALWTNPAGLARPSKDMVTFLDTQGNLFITPNQINGLVNLVNSGKLSNFSLTDPASLEAVDFLQDLLASNGLGFGASVTPFGMVINGLGMALNFSTDTYARGDTLTGTTSVTEAIIGGVIGFAMPVKLGAVTLYFGIDVRPMGRLVSFNSVVDVLGSLGPSGTSLVSTAKVGLSPAFAIDVGVLGEVGDWSFGASLRDSSTPLNYKFYTLEKVLANPGNLGAGEASVDTYLVPLTLAAGAAWEPREGAVWNVVVPKVSLDLSIPFQGEQTPSWGTWFHLGTEVTILNYLSLRAGLNQGYVTAGFGIRLGILESSFAVYSQELGRYAGEERRTSMALGARIIL